MTGSDSLPFEEKHKQEGQSFRFGGMVLIAANTDIATSDYTSGLQRRRITVRLENVVPLQERRDLDIEFEQYLPGVIKWVLDMPQQTMKSFILYTERCVGTLAGVSLQTLVTNNPIAAWSHECLACITGTVARVGNIDRDGRTKEIMNTDKLYPNYVKWTEATGRKAMAVNTFIPALRDLLCFQLKLSGCEHKRDRAGGHFTGLAIRYPSNAEDLSPLEQCFGKCGEASSRDGLGGVCDTAVTDGMTDQNGSVTNVIDFKEHNTLERKGGEDIEDIIDTDLSIGESLTPPKTVTSSTEPLKPVTGPSQTEKTHHSPPHGPSQDDISDGPPEIPSAPADGPPEVMVEEII